MMTEPVTDTYYNLIVKSFPGVVPVRYRDAVTIGGKMGHLLWMLENMPPEKTPKYNRWLGFIQGVLSAYNMRTIDEMRDDNR